MNIDILKKIDSLKRKNISYCLISHLHNSKQYLITKATDKDHHIFNKKNIHQLLDDGHLSFKEDEYFYHFMHSKKKIIIIGAVHISQYLIPLCHQLDIAYDIVDPRGLFSMQDRFPTEKIKTLWPSDYFKDAIINNQTAIITLTHDPKIDDEALEVALNSSAFYIGALGSKKTHQSRFQRLKEKGFDDLKIDKISAPIGLNIHSKKPAEIALSIMAEIIKTYNSLS